jgi:membrane protease YdiL (CAAX protease family)
VGLITGVIYNWWMIRTKSLWDCILMHAVTNGALAWYVLAHDQWQYWL